MCRPRLLIVKVMRVKGHPSGNCVYVDKEGDTTPRSKKGFMKSTG
jgi:hypothetical protein